MAPCFSSFLAFFFGFLTVFPLTQSVSLFFYFAPAAPVNASNGRLALASRPRPVRRVKRVALARAKPSKRVEFMRPYPFPCAVNRATAGRNAVAVRRG